MKPTPSSHLRDSGRDQSASSPATSETRVLIVDDEPTLRLSFGFALENEGYLVESAADGDAALERLNHAEEPVPAAIMLDLRMPGKSGLDVLREMKAASLFVPTVIVSAYIDSPTAVEAVDLGVVDFLKKPVTPDQVRGVIGAMLREEGEAGGGGPNEGEAGNPVTLARWHLRRRDVEAASRVFAEAEFDGDDAVASFWRMLTEHLRACRESGGDGTEFASSRFYNSADLLGMLAFNA